MSKPTNSNPTFSQLASNWRINSLVPVVQVTETSWGFDFPVLPTEAGYCICNYSQAITQGRIRMAGRIEGTDPVFGANGYTPGQGLAPNFRFVLWQLQNWNEENDRLWSNPDCVELSNHALSQVFTFEVPLVPELWSDVFGQPATKQGMAAMLRNIAQVGITFGAGSSFGHGVGLVSGAAKFICTEFKLL